jgi:FkbM family methyltransferase
VAEARTFSGYPAIARLRRWIAEGVIAVVRIAPPSATKALLTFVINRFWIPPPARWFMKRLATELGHRIPAVATLKNGDRIKVVWNDFIGQEIYYYGCYEPETVAMIENALKPGSVFLDIGAHVGQYCVIASRIVDSTGAVHAFEPDPDTFGLLAENVAGLSNVRANQLALSDQNGMVRFYLSDSAHIGFNSLRPPHECGSDKTCDVTAKTLDEYLSEHGDRRVDFIKMDVEGGELNVLAGAQRLLESSPKPTILLEFNPKALAQFGHTCEDLQVFLQQRGYSLFSVDGPLVPGSTRKAVFNVLAVPPNAVLPVPARLLLGDKI